MPRRRTYRVAVVMFLHVWMAWGAEQPVALILAGEGGSFARATDKAGLTLHAGEVLFDGDTFRTGDTPAKVLHCPSRQIFELPPHAVALASQKQLSVRPRIRASVRTVPACEMPMLERTPRAEESHLGRSLFAREALLDSLPGTGPRTEAETAEFVLRLARAERQNRSAEALEISRTLARNWTDAAWLKPRIFQHGEAVAAEKKPAGGSPRTFAVVIGISKYKNLPATGQLYYARADAELFAQYLRTPRGGGLPNDRILLLLDEQATAPAIRAALNTLLKQANPTDTVVLFLAGHGMTQEKGGEGYLIAYDTDRQNLRDSAISMHDLHQLVTGNAAHVNAIMAYVDACRSGKVAAIHRELKDLDVPEGKLFGFTASEASENSYEKPELGGGHGVFSWHLYEALNGGGSSGRSVTIDDLIEYVRQKVRASTAGKQNPDTFGSFRRQAVLADLRLPGPMIPVAVVRRGPAISRGIEDSAPRVALEDRGQSVILRYLRGEEDPLRREDFRDAAESFAAARKLAPESVWLEARETFCRGRVALFDKQYDRAVELLDRAVRLDPAGAVAYNALGIAWLERAEYTRALAAFEDAIRRAPRWAYAWHNRALAETQAGDYGSAIASYRRAIECAPQYSYLPYNLGVLYQNLNRRREAEAQYKKAMELAPGRAEPYNALGTLRAAERKPAQAERLFRKALELNPTLDVARRNLDALQAEQEKHRRTK